MLNYFVLGGSGNFVSSIPQIIFVGIIPIIKYLNAFFAIIFIFTPFILAINSTGNLFSAMCENISLIKRKLDYYLWLILIAILFSIILSVTMELLNPSSKSYLNSSVKELAYSAMRSLIFNFFLLTFFITGFRSVINFSRRSDYLKNKSSKSF
ncbi:MAG: hypothetical protein Q7S18_00545 [bacterium]|nr:hypothetical protein [bacterium]